MAFNADPLFYLFMIIGGAIFLFVWLMHIVSLWRRRKQATDRTHYIEDIIWTVTPALILFGLGIYLL